MTDSGLRRLAIALVRHAGRALPKARFQWATAMAHEVGCITDDAAALRWAFGCVLASYKERITAMGVPAVNPGPTIASPDDDPFLWLEERDSQRALAWVEEQNAATLARFASDARYAADRDALTALYQRTDKVPWVNRRGSKLYNFWKDAGHPRGVWRTTSLESYRSDAPAWDVVIDVDALAAREGEDWVWRGATVVGSHDRAMVGVSRSGRGEAVVLREFDIEARDFVPGGFVLPEARSWVYWLDRDTLLLSSTLGEGMATHTGQPRTVRLWRRGEDPLRAPVIFEIRPESVQVSIENEDEADGDGLWFYEVMGNFAWRVWVGDRTGAKTRLDLPQDAVMFRQHGWLVIKVTTEWSVDGEVYAAGTIIVIRFKDFLAGDRRFTRLFEPQSRRTISQFTWSGGRLILAILDNLEPVIEVLTPSATGWSRERVSGLPDMGVVSAHRLDSLDHGSNGDFIAKAETPLTPPTTFFVRPGRAPELLKREPASFNAEGLVVTRHEAVSKDGERVPYTQVGPRDETGEAPVHLSSEGSGEFGLTKLPHYDSSIGKLWLERGGTRAIAHIRGGDELGPAWHQAGRREGQRLAHDDFAAIAADLVRRGFTRPGRIAAQGGPLVANMLTRYPERFGALFCAFPISDFRRLKKLKTMWIGDWGDPDKPEDWAYLAAMSAYHAAVPGRPYPPVLVATPRHTERQPVGHARKLAAKLQAMGYAAHYWEPEHGAGWSITDAERFAFPVLGYRFLRDAIGWDA